jgi:regulator of protease activity HflC (stomatin/prohibitin superfamily)
MKRAQSFLPKSHLALAILTASGIGFVLFLLKSIAVVPTGSIGVVDVLGRVSDQPLHPGVHLVNPVARVVKFSSQTKEIMETAEAPSKDGLIITADVSILYHIDPAKAKQVYQTIGTNYEQVVIVPQVRSLIRNATASYESQMLYTAKRQDFSQQLRKELSQVLEARGFIVEDAPLRNVKLPDSIQESIQKKLQAEQESQRMQFVLQQERQEAERKRIAARGTADAQRIIAQGLNDNVLRFREIEATEKLAGSENSKVVVVGGETKSPTLLLQP